MERSQAFCYPQINSSKPFQFQQIVLDVQPFGVAGQAAICGLSLCPDGVPELEPLPRRVCQTPLLQEAEDQLNEYFAGVRREFDLPLAAKGTAFQQTVWAQLRKIPYGEVRTYGQLAAALGKPKASRAVGSACHRNPLCIVVPCHRVIGADGSLTGYAAGLDIKEYLLELERF